ncbi:unnamed protein product [Parnassius apollo]|uniref:(apollo) hypothetical protein n=1 Tax=Parnassius apollo TaxID=110799 RepID=A0A8S3X9R8_PARAO|nr:unnamed protein product [Parnassius apollo]
MDQSQILKPLTLSITTRGIGMSICHMAYDISAAYGDVIRVPNIYSQYRVYLGILESKLQHIKRGIRVLPRLTDYTYNYAVACDAVNITRVPEPIRKIVNSIGYIEHDKKVYVPAVAREVLDQYERLVPRAETVLLSNLRRTVVALANPDTPQISRETFHNNNPIPGAIWTDHVLQNPDEIIPADYDLKDKFQHDNSVIMPWLYSLQKHVPKMVGGLVDLSPIGRLSLFVSNGMENLKVPDRRAGEDLNTYYRRCILEGNIRNYNALCPLEPANLIEGQLNLLGEYPDPVDLRYPIYCMRNPPVSVVEVTSDYKGICQIMYARMKMHNQI